MVGKIKLVASLALAIICLARPAQADITLTTLMPAQGDTIEVFYRVPAPVINPKTGKAVITPVVTNPKLKFKDATIKLFPDSGTGKRLPSWHGLLAIPADLNPGLYQLQVAGEDSVIRVGDGCFHVQSITLPKTKDNFIMSPGENEAIEQAKAVVTDRRYWSGRFIAPSKANRSAGFGLKRKVNGHLLKDYFHTGLDFAAALGSPVVATQAGKVVLAHEGFKLHGNVVAIDHGQGVVSFYIHLQKIKVAAGELVKAGQIIGAVGQTGRANGPHLHFSIYVNGTATNPEVWLNRIF